MYICTYSTEQLPTSETELANYDGYRVPFGKDDDDDVRG